MLNKTCGEIMKKDKYTVTKVKNEDKEELEGSYPAYMDKITLSEEQERRLLKEATDELEAIRGQRRALGLDEKWKMCDDYYFGKDIMTDGFNDTFNTHSALAKLKSDAVTWAIEQSLFESDKPFSITPRERYSQIARVEEICTKKENWLDYKWNYLPIEEAYGLCIHSAVWKGVGILKWYHEIDKEDRERTETYIPEKEKIYNEKMEVIGEKILPNRAEDFKNAHMKRMEATGQMSQFMNDYRMLLEGKTVTINIKYEDVIYNDPKSNNVNLENFYVDCDCLKNDGLKTANTFEILSYSYRELMDKQREGEFYNVEKLFNENEEEYYDDYKIRKYDIVMAINYVYLDEDDKEPTKLVFWFSEEKECIIGSIMYPYANIPTPYVAHYISNKQQGFYEDGLAIGSGLIDSNITIDVLRNFSLSGVLRENTDTPIVREGSMLIKQYAEKKIGEGIPLIIGDDETPDFLSNYRRNPFDIGKIIALDQLIYRDADDSSGVSSLKSGRESISDPDAPAKKTELLLQQSGQAIKKYVKKMLPSFNISGNILIKMYAQIDDEANYQYKQNVEDVVGSPNPFNSLTRDELMTESQIMSQAYNFDFEKLTYNKLLLALKQILDMEPMFRQNPQAVYSMLRTIIKTWHPLISRKLNEFLPSPQEFEKQMNMIAIQAVDQYIKITTESAKATGQPVQYDKKQLITVVKQMLAQSINPKPKEDKR